MDLKKIFNIKQDIDESNIVIKSFNYCEDKENDYYNLDVIFNIYPKIPDKNNNRDSYLEFYSSQNTTINARVLFRNVSDFSIKNINREKQITGLEIIDNKKRGFQKEIRYEIKDFEEDEIHLYCEEIILFV